MNATVLIVDDNATLAYFSARNLQRDLPETLVLSATSCRQAWEIVDQHRPEVLVADLVLADGDGMELIREMSIRLPGLQAILITGEEPDPLTQNALFGFLVKPYEAEELAWLVRSALDSKTSVSTPAMGAILSAEHAYDRHHIRNRLAGLLAGLRAFGADLRANAENPQAVNATVDEYLDRLCSVVQEVSRMLPDSRKRGKDSCR
ncbi:MAG: response regulator [Desulfomonile sp.]|nr:response regulator [Desulfomonile sp.]